MSPIPIRRCTVVPGCRMTELRLVLVIVGALILGIIWFLGTRRERADRKRDLPNIDQAFSDQQSTSPRSGTLDDDLEDELNRLGSIISADRQATSRDELSIDARESRPSEASAHGAQDADEPRLSSQPEKIINLFLLCQKGLYLDMQRIHDAATDVGMVFGEMKIYHRLLDDQPDSPAVFSLANVTNPGVFDHSEHMLTQGVCLFMTLPNPMAALDGWDTMLATGQRLATLLNADLLDDSQSTLSRQRIAHIRDELRQYDQQHG